MKTCDFNYHLPKELIAQHPANPRDSSRLLIFEKRTGKVDHKIFRELPEVLQAGDVLVLNESKVIPARLQTQDGREVFLTRRVDSSSCREVNVWRCLVRGGKYFRAGDDFKIGECFSGEVLKVLEGGERVVRFHSQNFEKDLQRFGASPLPPYIHQSQKKVPQYQTTFAKRDGSVAAPTAGLHFTPRIFKKLLEKQITVEKITLHVGLGTFAPVKTETVENHKMHSEFFILPQETAERLNKAKQAGQRIIAVGSTSCRVLESCASKTGNLIPQSGETSIFMYPGYEFEFISGMLTNFHLPKSTLIMLVAALVGREKIIELYEIAKQKNYRFYSFGDAMLLV